MAKGFREARVKRVGNLWQELTSIGNLMLAAKRAAAGKRTRPVRVRVPKRGAGAESRVVVRKVL